MGKTKTVFIGYDDEDNEIKHSFPAKLEVCSDCEGEGFVLNESMRFHAYTEEEFSDFDDEDRGEYFKSGGIYDVVCPTCKGKNVELVIDESSFSSEDKQAFIQYNEYLKDQADFRAEQAAERRMGA